MSGLEWVVEAHGCTSRDLTSLPKLQHLFESIIGDLTLHPVGSGHWHQFPGCGGVTGLQMLEESHLACHTFPEWGSLCLNVFCCSPREQADFEGLLKHDFGATRVQVRQIERPYQA